MAKVHSVLAQQVRAAGIDTVFGLVGDNNLSFAVSLIDEGLTYYGATQEASAVLMADGYARRSGRIGLATVTQGPGVLNSVAALAEASRNRTPLLVVAGGSPSTDRVDLGVSRLVGTSPMSTRKGISHRDVVLTTGAGYDVVRSAETAAHDIVVALQRAAVERRPIVLDVPLDVATLDAPAGDTATVNAALGTPPSPQRVGPDPEVLDRAVGVIASSRRPIILVGRGGIEAKDSILRLAEWLDAPVATTLMGKGLFQGHPLDLGIFGSLSSPTTSEIIGMSDTVIAFGAGLNPFTTFRGTLLEGKGVVHCDLDPLQIGRSTPVSVEVVGDASQVAEAFLKLLVEADIRASGWRDANLQEKLAPPAPAPAGGHGETDGARNIRFPEVLAWVNANMPSPRSLTVDVGRFMIATVKNLTLETPKDFMFSSSGAIGMGLPLSMGAQLASPDALALAVVGDGGFMLGGLSDFSTAVRYGVRMVVIVCNDRAYGAEINNLDTDQTASLDNYQSNAGKDNIVRFDWPDLAGVAQALGGHGITVEHPEDLVRVEEALANNAYPLLLDVRVDSPW